MKKNTILKILSALALTSLFSCVDHRPLRNGVFDENIFLGKDFLTRVNPHRTDTGDKTWLYKVTVMKGSVPDEMAALIPGDNSPTRYVEFRFNNKSMEMVDANELAPLVADAEGNEHMSDSLARGVLNVWPGSHVDIKMRDTLDGERTNFLEENQEAPWAERQWFKVNFEEAKVPDINMLTWYATDYSIGECAHLRSVTMVPDSFEIEDKGETGGDDYLSWTVAVTYDLAIFGGGYYCGGKLSEAMNRSTFTYHVKYSFWRPPASTYEPKEMAEKDPIRTKLGAFETGIWNSLTIFQDPNTDITGAKSFLNRFDPNKNHTFYFSKSFPEPYKDHFRTNVANQINSLMEEIGAAMRIDFQDWNYGDKERSFGDIRYSMITFHDIPSVSGIIGMAYHNYDPRTGEILAAGFNMYDWVDKLYAFYLQDYISTVTADTFDDEKNPLPTPCTPGETVPIDPTKVDANYQNTSLLSKMENYMGQPGSAWVEPRSEEFGNYMRMLLPDIRFAVPGWNSYVNASPGLDRASYDKMVEVERNFQEASESLERGESPFGANNVLAEGAIEKGVEHLNLMKEGLRNHQKLQNFRQVHDGRRMTENVSNWGLMPAMVRSSRKCMEGGTWETRDEWAQRILDAWFKVFATHEFGHSLSLRHNFYGSVDGPHMAEGEITSSIMEYAFTLAEGAESAKFKAWDVMALKWIYGGVEPAEGENYLYCTDEHTYFSPLCVPHDIGMTPAEIIKNDIDYYDWMYKFRNFRAFRKFWSPDYYGGTIANTLYPMRRFLNLWALDWNSSDIQNDLILLGVKGDQLFFDNILYEFREEMGQANRLVGNFYKAILQQSSAERSYATKFDNFYGDVTQQGIILDKYYAMLLFIGLWPVDDYDQNMYSSLSFHESSLGNNLFYSDMQDVTSSMIGGQYDVYPWFVPTAVLLFSQDTHDVMFGDNAKQKWIEMKRFDRVSDMVEVFGFDPRDQALAVDNPYQTFQDQKGDTWIYYYMVDRNQHLVASKNWNPTAFKVIWDQNESINVNKSTYLDDYTLKYYLDFYEYFN